MTLRQAALVAGFAYLLNPVTYAEFSLYPRVVVPSNPAQTVQNMHVEGMLFGAAILCYLINAIEDVIIAWALYVLLVPVSKSLSLLASWFRLLYAALALFGVVQLATAFRLVNGPYAKTFAPRELQAQVQMLLDSFRYGWSLSLCIFAIHLVLIGYLIYRSKFIPWILGILLVVDGLGWFVSGLRPYLYPGANLSWLFTISFVELLLPLWLIIFGWRIRQPHNNAHSVR